MLIFILFSFPFKKFKISRKISKTHTQSAKTILSGSLKMSTTSVILFIQIMTMKKKKQIMTMKARQWNLYLEEDSFGKNAWIKHSFALNFALCSEWTWTEGFIFAQFFLKKQRKNPVKMGEIYVKKHTGYLVGKKIKFYSRQLKTIGSISSILILENLV